MSNSLNIFSPIGKGLKTYKMRSYTNYHYILKSSKSDSHLSKVPLWDVPRSTLILSRWVAIFNLVCVMAFRGVSWQIKSKNSLNKNITKYQRVHKDYYYYYILLRQWVYKD